MLLSGFEAGSAEFAAAEEFVRTLGDQLELPIFVKDRNSVFVGCNRAFLDLLGVPSSEIIGRTDAELWGQSGDTMHYVVWDERVMGSSLAAIGIKEPLRLPNGSIRWLETDKYPLRTDSDTVIGLLGCIRDVTDLVNAEHELQRRLDSLERQLQEKSDELELASLSLRKEMRHRELFETSQREQREVLEVLERTAAEVQDSWELDGVMTAVVIAVKQLLSVDLVCVSFLDEDADEPRKTRVVCDENYVSEETHRVDELLEWLAGPGGPGDYNGDTCAVPKDLWIGPAGSAIAAAMVLSDRRVGYLIAESGAGHLNSDFATDRLATVAKQCAAMLSAVRLAEGAARAAAVHERERLARDLHDTVSQAVASIGLLSEVALELTGPNDPLEEIVDRMHSSAAVAQVEMRSLLLELRDDELAKACLLELLDSASTVLAARSDIAVTTDFSQVQVSSDATVAAYRIVQEALHNIERHANASAVTVRVTSEPPMIMVTDDGDGFDPTISTDGHYGLSIMKERAEGIGSSLVVTSVPGLGTEVVLALGETAFASSEPS